jgi:hypothetical protein
MDLQEIQVQIDKDGKVRVNLHGVKGDACLAITKDLEALLGNQIEERKFNHEYYDSSNQQITSVTTNGKR